MGGPGSGRKPSKAIPKYWRPGYFQGADHRAGPIRKMQMRIERAVADLGGLSNLTQFERDLLERAAHGHGIAEKEEAKMRAGEKPDLVAWTMGVNVAVRVAALLGTRRRTREVPHLQEYLEQRAAEKDGDDASA